MTPSAERLDYLRASRAESCTRCGLHRGRNQLVFGSGNPDAAIVLVGEGPGAQENDTGEPFVGDAGHALDNLLRRAELARDDLYICNVVKCRPPANRDPEPHEIQACAPFLHMQLRIVRPRAILAVGRFAGRYLVGESEDAPLGYMRKRDWLYRNETTRFQCPVIVTYHPAAILHSRRDPQKAKHMALCILSDLNKVKRIVGGV